MPKKLTPRITRKGFAASNQAFAELYVYGVFDNTENWSQYQGWINDIMNSGASIVVFSTFHVDTDGNLYGSVPLVTNGVFNPDNQLNPDLQALYQQLANSGQILLYSIGNAAGTASDMAALQTILSDPDGAAYANLQNNMTVLTQTLMIQAIDFDFEPGDYTTALQTVVTQFTELCYHLSLGVTYCPYLSEQWWIDAQINAFKELGDNVVLWWNVQCYPDLGNSPAGWLPLVQQNAKAMGVSDPTAFIVPGTTTSLTQAQAQTQFSDWAGATPDLNAGFMWQFGDMIPNNSAASYMNAVIQGLQNPTMAAKKRRK